MEENIKPNQQPVAEQIVSPSVAPVTSASPSVRISSETKDNGGMGNFADIFTLINNPEFKVILNSVGKFLKILSTDMPQINKFFKIIEIFSPGCNHSAP